MTNFTDFNKDLLLTLSFGFSDPKDSSGHKMSLSAISSLINQGADPNFICPITNISMLAYAVRTKDRDVCELMLSLGANFDSYGLNYAIVTMVQAIKWMPHWLADLYAIEPKFKVISLEMHNDFKLLVGIDHKYEDMPSFILRTMNPDEVFTAIDFKVSTDIKIFDINVLNKAISNEHGKTREQLRSLRDTGSYRRMASANSQFKLNLVEDLKEKFPNFIEAIHYIVRFVSLSQLDNNQWFYMQPLLLVGEPGIGKTKFLSAVSKALSIDLKLVGCSSVTAGWVLGGSSTSWSDGKPGLIYSAIKSGDIANPIVMLDEIDKLGGDSRYDGYGPLYQLLERGTSENFIDEAVTVPVNCANINWIATANKLDSIPEPIQQRFNTIHIPAPSQEQMLKIAKSVYDDVLSEFYSAWGSRFNPILSPEIIDCLTSMPPREMRNKILEAVGNAANSREESIFSLNFEDFNSVATHKKRGPGF